jgi:ParB family chromosome partitioning protein
MNRERSTRIEMVPIAEIAIVNPRSRGRGKFQQIVENTSHLGLKRPITVAPRASKGDGKKYDLVCGQGRLEAFLALGQAEVPAFVVDASREELMLMSLAENLARRKRGAPELVSAIAALKDRGYTFSQIAKKIDEDVAYVNGAMRLLSKGEERLIRAVERQEIPLSIAITIASAEEAEVQQALAEAYDKKVLRGKGMLRAKKLIEMRRARGKRLNASRAPGEPLSADAVLKEYEEETARQAVLVRQAKVCETKLLFVVATIRQLLGDGDFVTLLREQKLEQMPQYLVEKMRSKKEAG